MMTVDFLLIRLGLILPFPNRSKIVYSFRVTPQKAGPHEWRPGEPMELVIVSAVALLLFVYLLAAIVWPEKF